MQLLKKWLNPAQSGLVGLDIGSGAVKLVGLRRGPSGWTASCASWAEIEPADDAAQQRAATLKAVRDCVKSVSSGATRYAVCGLSGPDAAVRSFAFPAMPAEQMEKALHFEAQQVCPMDMHRSVLDYQLLCPADAGDEAKKTQSGIMVAGTEQAINERGRLVREAGAKVALIDADGLAALNCLATLEDLDRFATVALIDMGQTYTNIILLGPNGRPFVRDVDTGSAALIEQIARKTNSDAQAVRSAIGSSDAQAIDENLLPALHQAAGPLIKGIRETLNYYVSHEKSPSAEKVYLCGGAALIGPLVEMLTDALPTAVEVFDPFKKIRVDDAIPGAKLLNTKGPAFAVAAGLAMRTV